MDLQFYSLVVVANQIAVCVSVTLVIFNLSSDLGNAALSGQLVPQLGLLKNLQYL